MVRQRNYTRVSEHCPGMGHEQQEYYDIEGNHMKTETESLLLFLENWESLKFIHLPHKLPDIVCNTIHL